MTTLGEYAQASYREAQGRAVAWVLAHGANPNPHYCYFMSAGSLAAVYKAHVATDPHYSNAHPKARWGALSYATQRGIVFG